MNYNTKALTLACIESIASSGCKIILVDNASSDGSKEIFSAWEKRSELNYFICNFENYGFARANNQGMELADTEYVLLLNSDTLTNSESLIKMIDWMECHPNVGASGPKLVYPDGTVQPSPSPTPSAWMYIVRFLGLKYLFPSCRSRRLVAKLFGKVLGDTLTSHMNPGEFNTANEIEYLSGAALLVRKEVIDQIGGLDEGYFMYLEDVDWCIRIRKAGWKLGFIPEVEILHYAGASFNNSELIRSYRADNPESFKSIMRYLYTYYGVWSRLAVRLVITFSLVCRSIYTIIRFVWRDEKNAVNYAKSCFKNISIVWNSKPIV